MVLMKQNMLPIENLVDIHGISELDYIKYTDNQGLSIGALTTHATVEESKLLKEKYPVLAEMEDNLAVPQTRNYGTIGGNVCHGDPAADVPGVLIAMNATYQLQGRDGDRILNAEDFYRDLLEVDLQEDEILCEVRVPALPANSGVAHDKLMIQKGDMGIVGAAVFVKVDPANGVCEDVRIALTNVSNVPFRARSSEKVLIGKKIDEKLLEKAGKIASEEVDPPSDTHGSAEYRKDMARVFLKRVTAKAYARAQKNQ